MIKLWALLGAVWISAIASPISDPALTGTRTEGSGITTEGPWAGDGADFTVDWNITALGGEMYHYMYSFSGFGGAAGGFSHWDLQLTPSCIDPGDDQCVTKAQLNGTPIAGGALDIAP